MIFDNFVRNVFNVILYTKYNKFIRSVKDDLEIRLIDSKNIRFYLNVECQWLIEDELRRIENINALIIDRCIVCNFNPKNNYEVKLSFGVYENMYSSYIYTIQISAIFRISKGTYDYIIYKFDGSIQNNIIIHRRDLKLLIKGK